MDSSLAGGIAELATTEWLTDYYWTEVSSNYAHITIYNIDNQQGPTV